MNFSGTLDRQYIRHHARQASCVRSVCKRGLKRAVAPVGGRVVRVCQWVCQCRCAAVLARHGTRWPTPDRMRQINALTETFKVCDNKGKTRAGVVARASGLHPRTATGTLHLLLKVTTVWSTQGVDPGCAFALLSDAK